MKSLEAYLEQVTEKDPERVIDALAHLELFSDVRAVTAIQNAFFHPVPQVRFAAAQAAGESLDDALLDALLSLLDDDDPQVRLAVVNAAGKFAHKGNKEKVVLALLERQPEAQTAEAVKTIILGAGPGVIPILESELNSLDKKRRERAIQLLPYLGDLGVMTLITQLPNLDVWESMESARMLGELDHPMLVDYFLDMLKHPEIVKRRFAMAAVQSGQTTLKGLHAVGEVLFNDPDQHMRLDAVVYLKWANAPVVLTYLDQFDESKEKGLYGRWIREIIRDTRIMLDLQNKSIMHVLTLLFVGEKHERPLACVELTRREDPLAIPFLSRALLSETANAVKANILVCLQNLEAVEAVDTILASFKGGYTNTEDELALRTLGRLYHPKALDYLQQRAKKPILNDIPAEANPIYAAREAVETVEMRMGFLKKAWFTMADEADEKRWFIAMLLAMRGDTRGLDLLLKHFKNLEYPAMRYQTLRALGESGSALVLPFIVDTLKAKDERLVWHALIAIGQLPLEKAPAEVPAMLLDTNPMVRMASLFALGRLGDDKTVDYVLKRLGDEDPYVRAVAVQSLAQFPFSLDWLPSLDQRLLDESPWARLETARLLWRERNISTREGLMLMLRDENQQIRWMGTKLASYYLDEDLRSALDYCASIKGGGARRNARELVERLNWQKWAKDPELLAKKKQEARAREEVKAREKRLRALRKEARVVLNRLISSGWKSLMVTYVAGSAYVDWENLYPPLHAGESLFLEAEPENVYGALAVMVKDSEGNQLGYIPRHDNRRLSQMLLNGEEVCTILLKVARETRVHQLYVEVFIKGEVES